MTSEIDRAILEGIEVHTPEGDEMPFGLFCPESDGKVVWFCGPDAEGKIVGTFEHREGELHDKRSSYLTKEEAHYYRDELLKAGWRHIPPPKLTFKTGDGATKEKLNRREKRFLTKKAKKEWKKQHIS